jgi:competence protein ComEC
MSALISILDVGHGNSAVLIDDKAVIIDAGPGSALLEFVTQEGITSIDTVLISHADKDHVEGLEGLIGLVSSEKLKINKIRINSDSTKLTKLWEDLLYTLQKFHYKNTLDFNIALTTGDSGKFNTSNIIVEVLAPSMILAGKGAGSYDHKDRKLTSNATSAVIRIKQGERNLILLPGDIDDIGLDSLLEDGHDIQAEILVFPHHGGKVGAGDTVVFTKRLCSLVNPNIVIFSIGRNNHRNPRPEVVSAIRESNPNAKILCTQLSLHCSKLIPSVLPTHLSGYYSAGILGRKCCSGTITLNLDSFDILPLYGPHQAFIKEFALTALCSKSKTS